MSETTLKAMQQATEAYDEAQKNLDAAGDVLKAAISAYTEAVAKLVHAELLSMSWHPVTGRGAHSLLEVDRPESGVLDEILRAVDACSRYGVSSDSHTFDSIHVQTLPSTWNHPKCLRVEKASLTKIGYKIERPAGDARKKMAALLKKHELTPEQLEELLKNQGAK